MTPDLAPDPELVARFAAARSRVLERIASAAARVGRDPADVRLVAVSKTFGADVVGAAVAAGLTTLGENRVQEAEAKAPELPDAVEWHLVGGLQSNKAARAIALFDVIQGVDSLALAQRLDRLADGRQVRILLQVNVDSDDAKGGFTPASVVHALPEVLALPGLRVEGLMTVGLLVGGAEAARPTFVRLRTLSERLRASSPGLGADLSMGMTDDFEVAVEEGSTIVRVGRALFGSRPTPAVDTAPPDLAS
ncbi:MAG: YggS family pyridoxal phosphate-dependent enzyme [Chloroflexota bacterium]